MTSACANPILYGFLNENFKKEFIILWEALSCCRQNNGGNSFNMENKKEKKGRAIEDETPVVNGHTAVWGSERAQAYSPSE